MVLARLLDDLRAGGTSLPDSPRILSIEGPVDRPVRGVTHDSREAGRDAVYVAFRGRSFDGHQFVPRLPDLAAAVVEEPVEVPPGVTRVLVDSTRRALAPLAASYFGYPGRDLAVVALTGTNGKTTTTYMVEAALGGGGGAVDHAVLTGGHSPPPVGVVGTTGLRFGGEPYLLPWVDPNAHVHTTPEATGLQSVLAAWRDRGARAVVMEASSIGIAAHRVDAIPFRVAVFTNLTQDHLDYHGTMEAYRAAKARLFHELLAPGGLALLNRDDPAWEFMRPHDREVWTYGLFEGDLHVTRLRAGPVSSEATVVTPAGVVELTVPLPGRHNVSNALAALGCALRLGVGLEEAARGLAASAVVPGRLEPVPSRAGFNVLVDYAHTPDALENVLRAVREVTVGRLWVVFGCGGDRDRGKRPIMGRIAGRMADEVVLTNDNPRSEDPAFILASILGGLEGAPARWRVEPDREAAIRLALRSAAEGDVVLLAGKGHETTQEQAGRLTPFDDREVARRVLRELEVR